MRGSHTHGWGDKKKRRGFGHAGGKGLAGRYTGAKKPSFWPEGRQHNKGFIPRNSIGSNAINVGDLNLMIEDKKVAKKGNSYEINLSGLGYTKLLSKGKLKYPVNVMVSSATEKAAKKVAEAGGNITKQ